MSRGVKDLRELICVSRLAGRLSDASDSDADDDFAAELLLRPDTVLSARQPPLPQPPSPPLSSPQSPPLQQQQQQQQKQKKKNKAKQQKQTSSSNSSSSSSSRGKNQPLPPVAAASSSASAAAAAASGGSGIDGGGISPASLDALLQQVNANFVADLLSRANAQLASLTDWCLSDDHFVDLANFWLTAFPEAKKRQLFSLEHSCLLDQLRFAFRCAAGPAELGRLLLAVFREFPDRLLSPRGAHLFLDHLDVLTSGRSHAECRRLLTDVRLATDVRQHAEWLLALRSFAICSVWTAVVDFYRSLVDRGDERPPPTEVPGFGDQLEGRVVRCIQQGYVEVLHYFCLSGKLDPRSFQDGQKRNLIFLSVTCAQRSKENAPQMRTLRYLLKRLQPDPPVDAASDTGNSALHLATSAGNLQLVELLVRHGRADVNLANPLCDDCTPLHLAVMYGHSQLVSCLLDNGADPGRRMGGRTALQLSEEAGDTYIHELLARAAAKSPSE